MSVVPGAAASVAAAPIDLARVRRYRLGRLQAELQRRDYPAAVLMASANIRYATDSRNMQVWCMHSPARYAVVPAEGPAVLFEFPGSEHLSGHLEGVGEVRPARSWIYYSAGPRLDERARAWAAEIADLVRERCGAARRLAVDRVDPPGARALEALGFQLVEAQEPIEHARAVKSPEEVGCIRAAVSACEAGMGRMREALRPGITENELWSLLHATNIARGGEWIETRLLTSGSRTNPWYQECSDKVIRGGELVAFDTDLIGPYGYLADLSRTYLCDPGRPTPEQRRLYRVAYDELHHNLGLLRVGAGFQEIAERSFRVPEEFRARRATCLVHGAGMSDEYPRIPYPEDFARVGYDGVLQENMVLCVESYIGAETGGEGVKLEQQVLLTSRGPELLSAFPFEDSLLA